MSFQNDVKTAQVARCVKYTIMAEVIDSVILINIFEQQCVVLNGILQSPHIKEHVKTIGIHQSERNSSLFENKMSSKHQEIIQT